MTDAKLYQVEDGWIETYTGIRFHFLRPTPEMISIDDIAHALSLQCRYNGHTKTFYSVAEHCVRMSDWMRGRGWSKLECLTALLHDAAETYIGDLPRPVKVKVPAFKQIEEVIDEVVAERFGTLFPFPQKIKELDSRILVDERANVMNPSDNEWGTDALEEMGFNPVGWGWSPDVAKRAFLGRYQSLSR